MTSVDLLGDDGREALNACVKVCILSNLSQPSISAVYEGLMDDALESKIVHSPTAVAFASVVLDAEERQFQTGCIANVTGTFPKMVLVPRTGFCKVMASPRCWQELTDLALIAGGKDKILREYSQTEATFGDSRDIFPTKRHETKDIAVKVYQSCDRSKDTQEETQESKRLVVECGQTELGSEGATASNYFNIGIGSGFILHNHFIVTSAHVLKTYNEAEGHQIRISNALIGELPCKVVYQDAGNDLALLYCPDLNLERSGIRPLHLSNQSLLPGMPIFSFGYPMGYAGDTAIFVTGDVSKISSSVMSLNCPLNSGNSGGPVMSWINNGQLKVVGIVTQKPFKEVLTLEEIDAVEKIRKSLQTSVVNPQPHLTLKLYDILKTHSLLDLSNGLPGCLVVEFIRNSTGKYEGEHKEELAKVVEWSIQDEL